MGDRSGYLKGSNGEKSSKRLFGAILVSIGGALITALGITSFFVEIADPETARSCGLTLLVTGGGLLGWGVLDGIGQVINNKIKGAPEVGF